MLFNVSRSSPYITAPRGVARVMVMDVCQQPVKLQNDLYEYLWAGNGILPKTLCSGTTSSACTPNLQTQGILRGYYPTLVDVPTTEDQYIRAYPTDPLDVGKRILIQAYDTNDVKIYGLNGMQQ